MSDPVVLDASVVVQLFFAEEHSEAAERRVRHAGELLAPDLIWAEIANVIWKRHRRGDLSEDDAQGIARQVRALPLRITGAFDLLPDALTLAMQLDRSVYDCLYLALAVRTGSILLTADQRLANALAPTPLAKHIVWIGAGSPGLIA